MDALERYLGKCFAAKLTHVMFEVPPEMFVMLDWGRVWKNETFPKVVRVVCTTQMHYGIAIYSTIVMSILSARNIEMETRVHLLANVF